MKPPGNHPQNRPSPEWNELIIKTREALNSGQTETAQELVQTLLAQSAEDAITNPDPAQTFRDLADACEEAGDWPHAEAARKEVLSLALENPTPGFSIKPHWELASHYSKRGLTHSALAHSTAALDGARGSEISSLISMALRRHCRTLLLKSDIAEATGAIEECLTLISDEPLAANARAEALILRARCAVFQNRIEAAEADLTSAAKILEPEKAPSLPAGKGLLALWWRVSSELCEKRNDLIGALKAAENDVDLHREIVSSHLQSPTTIHALVGSLRHLERCYRLNGLQRESAEAAAEANQIRVSMGLPLE